MNKTMIVVLALFMLIATIGISTAIEDMVLPALDCSVSGNNKCTADEVQPVLNEIEDQTNSNYADTRRQLVNIRGFIYSNDDELAYFKSQESAYLQDNTGSGMHEDDLIEFLANDYDPYLNALIKGYMQELKYKMYWNFGMLWAGPNATTSDIEMNSCKLYATQEQERMSWGDWVCYPDGTVLSKPERHITMIQE